MDRVDSVTFIRKGARATRKYSEMERNMTMISEHEIVLYQMDKTNICVNVFFGEETFWMTQKAMAELFDCSTENISLH